MSRFRCLVRFAFLLFLSTILVGVSSREELIFSFEDRPVRVQFVSGPWSASVNLVRVSKNHSGFRVVACGENTCELLAGIFGYI